MEVLVDGNQVFLTDGSNPACGVLGYVQQFVNLGGFADGELHTLEFHSETFSTNAGASNFFVDDVEVVPPPSRSKAKR
jgi:hypothetical protein